MNKHPELRHIVYQNPDQSPEYRDYTSSSAAKNTDYSSPEYYQEQAAQPYNSYAQVASPINAPFDDNQMQAYRGPQSLDGYTTDVGSEQREAAQRGSVDNGGARKKAAGLGGVAITIGSLLLKFSFILKFGGFALSAIVSAVLYSFIFGWPFAIGLLVQLFLHEMGHAIVMKIKGIPVGGIIFIPMMGAAVTMLKMPDNAKDEAEVGIAGPIAGAIAASACLLLAQQHPGTVWAPLAHFGFLINLLNLVPIVPFDGGRVLAAIDRRVWIVGFLLLLGFQIWSWWHGNVSIWLLILVIMAATQLFSRGLAPSTEESRAYYNVSTRSRIVLTVLYFGLAAVLYLGMTISFGLMNLR